MSEFPFNMVAHSSVLGHESLSNSAKLLYVWICSSRVDAKHKTVSWDDDDTEAGFSQKTNSYFAEKMHKGETYISQLITELETESFIYKKQKNISGRNYRRIWCTPETINQDEPPSAIGENGQTTLGHRSMRVRPEVNARSPIAEDHKKEGLSRSTNQEIEKNVLTTDRNPVVPATDGYILATALLKMIRRNKKYYSKIARFFSIEKEEESLRRWTRDIDLLLTRDAKAYDEVAKVLQWCQKDDFWQGQILSGNNFRKHYETLKLGSGGAIYGMESPNKNITDMLIKAYGWLCNNSNWQPQRRQMPKFLEATDRVTAFIDLHGDKDLTPEELIKYLRNCLQETWREKGEIVHPGHMNSDHTWDVLLPQYLENVIGAL